MKHQPPPILNYADAHINKWIPIAQFPDDISAHLASGKLNSEGIESLIEPGSLGSQANAVTGSNPTTLAVRSQDAAPAIDILKQTPAKQWLVAHKT